MFAYEPVFKVTIRQPNEELVRYTSKIEVALKLAELSDALGGEVWVEEVGEGG